jgi:hypothetical protein
MNFECEVMLLFARQGCGSVFVIEPHILYFKFQDSCLQYNFFCFEVNIWDTYIGVHFNILRLESNASST